MRVVAVVVTYERRELLERLLDRLAQVDELAEVLVVDNASRDETARWLGGRIAAQAPAGSGGPTLLSQTLPSNGGGAGGFHAGLEWAIERGADLVWLMDDDGLPDPGCLETLLDRRDQLDFWGPVVVDEAAPERLVFPIRLPGGTRVVHDTAAVEAAAVDGLLADVVIPFNGVLVTRALVEGIGLPRAEFFIWGDDHEYRLRAERAGARIATVAAARVRHPSVGELGSPMMGGRTTYNHSPSDLKGYCMARNNTVNLRDYRGWAHVAMFWVKTIWFYLFTRPQPRRLALSARAAVAGLRGDFTGHQRYLR